MALYEIARVSYWDTTGPPVGTVFTDQIEENGRMYRVFMGDTNNISAAEAEPERIAQAQQVEAHYAAQAVALANPEPWVDIQAINREMVLRDAQRGAFVGPSIHEPQIQVPIAGPTGAGGAMPYNPAYMQDPSRSWGSAITGALQGAAYGFLTGGPAGAAVGAAAGGAAGAFGGGSQATYSTATGGQTGGATGGYNPGYGYNPAGYGVGAPTCPTGYQMDAQGRCAAVGIQGMIQQWLPGGQTGYLPATSQTAQLGAQGSAQAVMGAYGAALLPFQVGTINGKPVLRCWPPGLVLGKDSLCYNRSTLRRDERKWPAARRPLLSANDGKILEKAHGLESKLLRVAGRFLAPSRPHAPRRGKGRGKKK